MEKHIMQQPLQQPQQLAMTTEEVIESLKTQLTQSLLAKIDMEKSLQIEEDKIIRLRNTLQGMELAAQTSTKENASEDTGQGASKE